MLKPMTTPLVICLTCLLGLAELLEQKVCKNFKKQNSGSQDKSFVFNPEEQSVSRLQRDVDDNDNLQEIVKCCPEGLHIDDWYKCVENSEVGKNTFSDELFEVGAKDKDKYVIVHSAEWRKCPLRQRKEFEVLHIPHDKNNTVYVFAELEINYDVFENEEIKFDGFKEIK